MKIQKKIILCIIIFLTIVMVRTKVNATQISISPSNPKVGDKVTVTVKVPNVHTVDVTANVSGAVSGTIKVVGGDIGGKAKTYSNSSTFKCKKEGKINVEVTSGSTAVLSGKYVNVGASKTATVSKKTSSKIKINLSLLKIFSYFKFFSSKNFPIINFLLSKSK